MLEARRIARNVLVRVEKGGAFANRALDAAVSEAGRLDPRDVSLATELVYGTLRRLISIDHALAHFSKQPLAELDYDTRALLRLGAYQLMYLRIPDRASVHATVELAKEVNRGRPVKYVNAVLRSLARERSNILVPPKSVDPAGHLSIEESYPRWLVEKLLAWRGEAWTSELLHASNQPAPMTVRVNRLKSDRAHAIHTIKEQAELDALPTRFSPAGFTIESARRPGELLRPSHGMWQAQDEAAQLVGFFASPRAGMKVLDACAAPGGKTCHLAELMDDQGSVDACDVHAGKLRDVEEGARRLGLQSVRVHPGDAALPFPFAPEGGWDLAMVDAPCSGLGTLRRHPELKTRRTAEDINRLAELQGRILENVANHVRPGGVLVYAVCTFTKEEGVAQIERFLSRHPEWSRDRAPPGIEWGELLDERGDLVLDPHRHGTDAFYAARLVRRNPA